MSTTQDLERENQVTLPESTSPNILDFRFQFGAAEKNVAKLLHQAGLAEEILKGDDFHLKVENKPYIPLSIERHGQKLYLTHFLSDYSGATMTDDKWGQPSNELSVGATSDLTYGCPHLSRESLGAYFVFANPKVQFPNVIEPHCQMTVGSRPSKNGQPSTKDPSLQTDKLKTRLPVFTGLNEAVSSQIGHHLVLRLRHHLRNCSQQARHPSSPCSPTPTKLLSQP